MPNREVELSRRGICVIIPTYNNAGTIVDVVSRAQAQCRDVFVVCDGCTDDTLERIGAMETQPRLVVLSENKGKGRALKEGFKAALEAGFAYAITLDADLQHYPEDIPLFLEANRKHPGALIVGERRGLDGVERSKGSSFANGFSNFWFFLQTFRPLKDTQTGYRLYPLKKMRGLSLLTSRYEAELELLVFAAWNGVEIATVDVDVFYPPKGERVSHFRPFLDFLRISVLNVVLCILALVYGLPRFILRWTWTILKSLLSFLFYALSLLFIVTPAMFFYLKVGGATEKKKEKLHRIICRLSRIALVRPGLPGVSYSQVNPYGEDFSRPAVIICNHQSHLDLLPMLSLTPNLVALTTNWVWHNPLYGIIIRNADYLPASDGLEAITPKLKELVAKGYSVAVYPEGTRSLDCSIGRFHQGAFYLARKLDVDILPVVLYGAGKALPKHGRYLRRWPIHLEIDRRIPAAQLSEYGETFREQASRMRAYYKERYAEVADRMEQTLK